MKQTIAKPARKLTPCTMANCNHVGLWELDRLGLPLPEHRKRSGRIGDNAHPRAVFNGETLLLRRVFEPGVYPILVRFSSPSPARPDAGLKVRSFAMQFTLPHHEQWCTWMRYLLTSVAKERDPVNGATRRWPAERDRDSAAAGALVIDHAQSQIDGPWRDISFDPLILSRGIEASSDPMLAARASTYAFPYNHRASGEDSYGATKK